MDEVQFSRWFATTGEAERFCFALRQQGVSASRHCWRDPQNGAEGLSLRTVVVWTELQIDDE